MKDVSFVIGVLLLVCLFYQCYTKAREYLTDDSPVGYHSNSPHHAEHLRRLRERLSKRRGGKDGTAAPDEDNAGSVATRQELIEHNLFGQKIRREESVRELARLLAVARGGAVDEELGEAEASIKPDFTCSLSEAIDTIDAATVTPQPHTTDPIATAVATPPEPPSCSANGPPKDQRDLEPIRTLWSSLANHPSGSERSNDSKAAPPTACPANPSAAALSAHTFECSVCLDPYASGAVVAWAKHGGSNGRETECDHIFHKECLVAWLQDHDDCPLCRRKVVHADAEARFAGWGTG
jgi:hypothetical protein